MTPREIIYANLAHDNPERPGMNFTGNRLNDFLGVGLSGSLTYTQRRWQEGRFEYYDDEWGNLWFRVIGGATSGEIFRPAIEDWRQLESLQLPDYDDIRRYEDMGRLFAQPTDHFKIVFLPGWVFATSRYLRKMEIYFTDLVEYREEIDRLHELVTDLFVRTIRRCGAHGAEGIFYCEDLGIQDRLLIGPAMWRDVFKPHYCRLTDTAHECGMKVFMHSCGYNWELVDDLVDAGIDCFQFDQPAAYDQPALADKLRRHKVALWAPVDIQQVMPTGDRALIEQAAVEMVRTYQGGLIMKDYPDLPSIGVQPAWDQWAYEAVLRTAGV